MSKATPPAGKQRLLVEERRRMIAEFVQQNGRATVEQLAEKFRTSTVTIRSDLEELAGRAAIVRAHGGALPVLHQTSSDPPLRVKEAQRHPEKQRIGQEAAKLIKEGDTIVLDSGSTTVEIARRIRLMKLQSLTVITNALNIAMELSDLPGIRVMMLGGLLRHASYSLVGPDAEQSLSRLSADKLFLGVDGLDVSVGVTTPDPLEARLNALMIRIARETIAVFDATKLGHRSLSIIAPIRDVHLAVTDRSAAPEMVSALRQEGVRVLLA